MKKLLILLFSAFLLFPNCGFAFEIDELLKYQVAVKTFTASDSLYKQNKSQKTEIQSTQRLEEVLGANEKWFDTLYVHLDDSRKLEIENQTSWYFITPKSMKGKRKYNLHYRRTDVMYAARPGDTLVIAKKPTGDTIMLIVASGSDAEKEVLQKLKVRKPSAKKKSESKSWFALLFDSSEKSEPIVSVADNDELPELQEVEISSKIFTTRFYTPGPDCENGIISELNKAKKSVDIAVYSINNPRIFTALEKAHNRGVKIRVITDRLESSKKNAKILMAKMDEMGIPIRKNRKHRIMHHKFAIFDNKSMSDGSFNWTDNATKTNAEDCTFSPSAPDRVERFNYLWDFYGKAQ
jgi:hypothetical protein